MSREGVQLAINKIADDLLALAAAILEDDTISTNDKVGRNTLRDSALKGDLETTVNTVAGNDPVIKALFNHYVIYLEWTRPPKYKKKPPISVLKDWAAKNGIPTDVDTLYRISYAIWRDGHKGRPIFATIDKELDGLFMGNWADKLFNSIVDDLDNFFNDN
ncbi:hypothetical protein L0O88_07390 [Bacteroides nordii]|uniref:hypothetical protein n=1 Tax=Bacteroides nordii TaxID=291645 RepID=UPI001EDFAA3D|nr:hypothetical protein [Bacteroides nordii]MCG4768911.1 hypothetical protein [Bacteroides nordii]